MIDSGNVLPPWAPAAAAALSLLVLHPAAGIDSEWPPAGDVINAQMSPGPGLTMGLIEIDIPAEFAAWFNHFHLVGEDANTWNSYALDFAIGDIEGIDDGDVDIVITMADEIVLGATLTIDRQGLSGSLTPLWCWKAPNAPATPPQDTHAGLDKHNVLIWDFDDDGSNEVAVVAPGQYDLWGTMVWGQAIYVLAEDPNPPPPPWEFSVPPPQVLAVSDASNNTATGEIGERLGICRVRDTNGRRDIVSTKHFGATLSIWKLEQANGVYTLDRVFSKPWQQLKTHEYNHADIDGDGYDEFAWDGIVDFVDDVNGVWTPTNTTNSLHGINRWSTGMTDNDHMDQMLLLDFDPAAPGLEVNSLPEFDWTDPTGAGHPGVDTLWKTDGTVLRVNDDIPWEHPQTMYVGNWTSSRNGFESLYVPKSFNNPIITGGETWLAAHYAVDAYQNELALDGGYWHSKKLDPPTNSFPVHRATGPCFRMQQIDWDGNHLQDEILHDFWQTMIVWRMGEKGDWGATPPPGMPTEAQLNDPWTEGGFQLWWEFYQGYNGQMIDQWAWNNGGPGRYTHYYSKLAEAFPGSGRWSGLAWDITGDYREEAVVVIHNRVNIFFNLDPISDPSQFASPTSDPEYRRLRMERVGEPYVFPPPAVGDIDGDGAIDVSDLLTVLASWGACPTAPPGAACPADIDPDGSVTIDDLLLLLGNWD
jgi:hypothetical protein